MEASIVNKEGVINILKQSQSIIQPCQRSKIGAEILLEIANILTDLDCCIKNIVHFTTTQRCIARLLEDRFNILETKEYDLIQNNIRRLKNSVNGLHGLSIKEVQGEDCGKDFVTALPVKFCYRASFPSRSIASLSPAYCARP